MARSSGLRAARDRARGTASESTSRGRGSRDGRGCAAVPRRRTARSRARPGSPRARLGADASRRSQRREVEPAARRRGARSARAHRPDSRSAPAPRGAAGEMRATASGSGKAPPLPRQRDQPRDHAARRRPGAVGRQQHLDGVLEERRRAEHPPAARARAPRRSAGSPRERGAAIRESSRSSEKTRAARSRVSAERAAARRPSPRGRRRARGTRQRRRPGGARVVSVAAPRVVGERRQVVPAVRAHDARRRRSPGGGGASCSEARSAAVADSTSARPSSRRASRAPAS